MYICTRIAAISKKPLVMLERHVPAIPERSDGKHPRSALALLPLPLLPILCLIKTIDVIIQAEVGNATRDLLLAPLGDGDENYRDRKQKSGLLNRVSAWS